MNAVAEKKLQPARLDVSMPFELPQGHKDAIAEAMAGDAWLQRLGLEGLLTGIAGGDVKAYRASVERLAGMLRYAREVGLKEGSDNALSAALLSSRRRLGYAALGGLALGVFFGVLLAA